MKFITNFQNTGVSEININLVCKKWDENFLISTWINSDIEKYTFVVLSKRKGYNRCKTEISKQQALQIVSELNLIHVKSKTFNSGGTYHCEKYVHNQIERLSKKQQYKEAELSVIENCLDELLSSIL